MNNTYVPQHRPLVLPRSNFESPLFSEPAVAQHGRSFVMSNVLKDGSCRRFLNLDTRFQDVALDTSAASHVFSLPEKISNVKSIAVRSVEIPLLFFNVSPEIENNTIAVSELGIETVLTIPSGNYTGATLVSEINSLLASSSSTLFAFTMSMAPGPTLALPQCQLAATIKTRSVVSTTTVTFPPNLAWMLGFRSAAAFGFACTLATPATTTVVSDTIINLSVPKYLYLVLDEFTTRKSPNSFYAPRFSKSVIHSDILARITLDNPNPTGSLASTVFVATKHNGHLISDTREYGHHHAKGGAVDIQKMHIQVINEFGNPLHFLGCDFSVCLELEIE